MTIPSYRKYSNKKVVTESGIKYDSKREAKRGAELELLRGIGAIHSLDRQIKFELIPKQDGERSCNYILDFRYFDREKGMWTWEDVKGMKTPEYVIKRKLMKMVHGITITEV
jgi:Protein of unknown function (DUF1064)